MLTKFKKITNDWARDKRGKLSKTRILKNLMMCEKCYAFYYKNSWHLKRPNYINEENENEVTVFFTECSACLEQEDALYEKEANFVLGLSME